MGLGKTVQVAVALRTLFESKSIGRALVVAPLSLLPTWRSELSKWCPTAPVVVYRGSDRFGLLQSSVPILLTSYETLSRDLSADTRQGQVYADIGIDVLIIDEAQRIKSPNSIRSRVISRILAPRRWALTGTPLENHPREFVSILRFLFPNEFLPGIVIDDWYQMLALRDLCLIRRKRTDVGLELPSRTVATVPLQMNPDQEAEYRHALEQVRSSVVFSTNSTERSAALLGGLQRLRRIASVSSEGSSAKLDFLCEEALALRNAGEKAVVFTSFPNLLRTSLDTRLSPRQLAFFTGKDSLEARNQAQERFISDPECTFMVASLIAGGVGVTWTIARLVYEVDLWWNPQAHKQAEDRVYRIGQERPVLIKRLVSEHTIEEGITLLLESKERVFDFVFDDLSESTNRLGGVDTLLSLVGLTKEDLGQSIRETR